MEKISVLGAGSWGTTLAALLSNKGFSVALWARSTSVATSINENRENRTYLPDVRLPGGLVATSNLEQALSGARVVLSAVPSLGVRAVFEKASALIPPDSLIVSASKGIEEDTCLTPTGIIRDVLGRDTDPARLVVISGPSFAREVSLRLPTAVCAASTSAESAARAQQVFSNPYFRVYTNTDVTGVELGGALKNVIAVASGISDGLQLGHNSRAALITRGLAEITRLGVKLGAAPMTFSGLSGLGDLVLTCTGALSRNYTLGRSIGEGRSLEEVTSRMRMVAEGVKTSRGARELARRSEVEMPITEAVYNVLYRSMPPEEAVCELMTRGLKDE